METWLQLLLGLAAVLATLSIAALARDRVLLTMIRDAKDDAIHVAATAKDDTAAMIAAHANALHERVNRVRDEYVRRDDLESHLMRFDKALDDMRGELRRTAENSEKRLDEIRKLLSK